LSLLLDSHVFLWFDRGDGRLPDSIRHHIDTTKDAYVSAVSIWELSIKRSLGKLPGLSGSLIEIAKRNHFQLLPVTPEHAEAVTTFERLHGDPFDHLLLAQAKTEGLTLVTHDDILARYGVPVLLV
jgi:PIN domain nuclease of toxin-antitoxin system